MIVLAAGAVYILISRRKEIVFSILNILKSKPSTLGVWFLHMLTSPIWFPLLLLDKKYNWGIYSSEISDFADDEMYPISTKLYFNFSDYQRFILISDSSKADILSSLDECFDTTPDFDTKVRLNQTDRGDFVLQLDRSVRFNQFSYLVQWLSTFCSGDKTIGIAINDVQKDLSFYMVSDTTQNHINSLTGKTLGGLKFSVNVLSDYDSGTWLGINEEINLDSNLDLNELMARVDSFLSPSN